MCVRGCRKPSNYQRDAIAFESADEYWRGRAFFYLSVPDLVGGPWPYIESHGVIIICDLRTPRPPVSGGFYDVAFGGV
jgi:hypothetical protein